MLCVIVEYIVWRKGVKLGLDWGVGSSRRVQAILQERSCNEAGYHPLLEIGIHKRISDLYFFHSLTCLFTLCSFVGYSRQDFLI